MKLRFTPTALNELDKVLDDISRHSSRGASRVQARIKTIIDLLLEHPNASQRTDLTSVRRIVATP
jgi:toxin ParE1/3/4